jgi:CheY-like chemotaxis protein
LLNLIGNAIKFSDGGRIEVSVALSDSKAGGVTLMFSVSDNGPGIPADKLEVIFEPFRQVDGTATRNYGGTGLGLAICASLTHMMGGRIWAESKLGYGTTLYFTAQFQTTTESSEPALPAAWSVAMDEVPLRILVAEDNKINQLILERLLASRGHIVSTVSSGEEAVAQLTKRDFQVVLMDVQMPGLDGLAATRLIREREKVSGKSVPIIALTANAMQGDREKCLASGMNAYLAKPFDPEELNEVLRQVMHPQKA